MTDVIDLHVSPDEAFPSSGENNTPDTEADSFKVAQVAQVKLAVNSRMGIRVEPEGNTMGRNQFPINFELYL